MNHELCASLLKEELQELDSVAAQAVFVHDHNLLDHAAQDAFQEGKKTFAFEVEATADVGEDAVVGIGSLEVCDLALQILFLVGATDASVDAPFRLCICTSLSAANRLPTLSTKRISHWVIQKVFFNEKTKEQLRRTTAPQNNNNNNKKQKKKKGLTANCIFPKEVHKKNSFGSFR